MIKDILDTLIQDSLSMRITNRFSQEYRYNRGLEYAIQFKTIGLTTPRRYGKSSYIKEFALSTTDRVAIVVPNTLNNKFYDSNKSGARLYTVHELKNVDMFDICRTDYNWIFFDDVDVCSDLKYQFTNYFNNHCNTLQTFIWLNT